MSLSMRKRAKFPQQYALNAKHRSNGTSKSRYSNRSILNCFSRLSAGVFHNFQRSAASFFWHLPSASFKQVVDWSASLLLQGFLAAS